jgi:hypothetical protein
MPDYEVCIAASHCLHITAESRDEAEEKGLEKAKGMRGFAFDDIEVSQVNRIDPIDDMEAFKTDRDMEAA